jgi:lipoate-protein ligase A
MESALNRFRLLDTGPISGAENMALDKIILEEVAFGSSPPTLRFLQFKPSAALVGYHQDVSLEIRSDYCRDHGIDVNRRLTGGGSILFQESALGWEIFGRPGEDPFCGSYEDILRRICRCAADAISKLGAEAKFRPRNDIEVDGRKISGTGGTTVSGAYMFQGTLLLKNEIELFLKALRVPVEKLKKREIESLMERVCFLEDIVETLPPMRKIKEAIAEEFAGRFGLHLEPSGLTPNEKTRLNDELPYFAGEKWIMGRSRPEKESAPLRAITQTEAGTMRVHLWLAPGAKSIRQALIVGDFFAIPSRMIHDLEAALVGAPVESYRLGEFVSEFLDAYAGDILGIGKDRICSAITSAADRLSLARNFSTWEANDLFFLNLRPSQLNTCSPRWLLLPYCSKDLDCDFRKIPGCDQCGRCEIGSLFDLANEFGMEPLTIQSFEHLMDILLNKCSGGEGVFVGSCCEAFYSKHQVEMERARARGILVNLDSTTCYDLGKGTPAYRGNFDNKTNLNVALLEKTLRFLHAS